MSEVKRFTCWDSACIGEVNDPALDNQPFYVLASEYDALKAERDALLVLLKDMRDLATAIPPLMLAIENPHNPEAMDGLIERVNDHIDECDRALNNGRNDCKSCQSEGVTHTGVEESQQDPLGTRPAGCCCPPKGHTGIWAAAMCPVHFGLKRAALKP